MASGPSTAPAGAPFDHLGQDQDLIDPDEATLNDLDDPLESAPLTGNIGSSSTRAGQTQNLLNSSIQGEERRAPLNTIEESVWDTLSRDLRSSWKKMQLVLWPKYLLGGMLHREGGLGGAERGEGGNGAAAGPGGFSDGLRGFAGRISDADALLQGSTSDELRDWDLWGPLLFSILLSLLLSIAAGGKQTEDVFTGVFALVWIGTSIVTWQIRLLGGKIAFFQTVCIIGYTLFPLVFAAMLSAIGIPMIVRIPVYLVLLAWSFAAGTSILGGSGVVRHRVGLAVYPLFVFYLGLGCLCFIS